MLLQTDNITKIYRMDGTRVSALNGVSINIKEGEFISIMGPSGSGKSTLMHIIGLLDTPTSGSVFLENKKVSDFNENKLAELRNKKIGFVFQQFNLLPRLSALENVMIPLTYTNLPDKEVKKRALKSLEDVGLFNRQDHLSSQLSGGEQQRVAIARALVNNPTIIFADEPTGNLDSKSGKEIMEIFAKLNKAHHTIVVVTHEKHIAVYAQRIIQIKDGLLVKK